LCSAQAKLPEAFEGTVILSADTVVHQNQRCLGKPNDAEAAALMLTALSGGTHQVSTAVALRHEEGVLSFCVSSEVRFRQLSEMEIERYVRSGEPMDKAGAYGIQGLGAGLIASVSGSHTCVVGLPLSETLDALAQLGVFPR
jgi:septum formation protein